VNRDLELSNFVARDIHGKEVDQSIPLNTVPDRIIILEDKKKAAGGSGKIPLTGSSGGKNIGHKR